MNCGKPFSLGLIGITFLWCLACYMEAQILMGDVYYIWGFHSIHTLKCEKKDNFFFISFYPMVLTWTLTLSTAYQILVSAGRTNGVLIQLSSNPFRRESCQFLNWPPMCFKMRSNKHIEINAFQIKQKNPLCRKKIDLNFGSIICPTLPLFFALNLIILAKG